MTFAGTFGVPRRHWDISFANAPFTLELPPAVDLLMAGLGLGGSLAALAVLAFVAIAVVSVFFGKRLDLEDLSPGMRGVPQGVLRLPAQTHSVEASEAVEGTGAPGTVVLVGVFLTVFVLYYFTNWKLLSMVWKIG
jgi:cytochrome c oxidase subunit 1